MRPSRPSAFRGLSYLFLLILMASLVVLQAVALAGCLARNDDGFCGDGRCGDAETSVSCPIDCPAVCGDHACTNDETHFSCPQDCAIGCGDNVCRNGETAQSCERDCAPHRGDACSANCGADHACCHGIDGLYCVALPGTCP